MPSIQRARAAALAVALVAASPAACAAQGTGTPSAPVAAPASAAARRVPPEVLIVGTGGTIAVGSNYYGDRKGDVSRVAIEGLLAAAPGMDSLATLSSEEFSNVGSGRIGPVQWLALSRRISAVLRERPALRGVVVTHGTDTMEETAYFLDLTVADDRPVIVTGAMRPADAIGADGPANLYNAVRVAAAPLSVGRGTMVLMNDRVFAAREVTKTNTTRVETFEAPEHGPLAIVDHDTIAVNRSRPASRRTFDLAGVTQLPRVDVIYSYGGADSVLVDAAVAAGARGLVVASLGAGGVPPEQGRALQRAREKGVIVVISSRTGSGRTRAGAPSISAGDLNAQKARVLLMLALTRTSDRDGVKRIFEEYVGG